MVAILLTGSDTMTLFDYIIFVYLSLFIIKYALYLRTFDTWIMIVGKGHSRYMVYIVMVIFGATFIFITLLYLLLTERKEFFYSYSDEFMEGIKKL